MTHACRVARQESAFLTRPAIAQFHLALEHLNLGFAVGTGGNSEVGPIVDQPGAVRFDSEPDGWWRDVCHHRSRVKKASLRADQFKFSRCFESELRAFRKHDRRKATREPEPAFAQE